ncbi:unnamed protein product [Meloidogyne enterolobii]|uniref:Uncharacterized protein n=1 Tax=Meloidogyne enterolobii TaxID=390850 RepID=A0ACB1AN57_MELEN
MTTYDRDRGWPIRDLDWKMAEARPRSTLLETELFVYQINYFFPLFFVPSSKDIGFASIDSAISGNSIFFPFSSFFFSSFFIFSSFIIFGIFKLIFSFSSTFSSSKFE